MSEFNFKEYLDGAKEHFDKMSDEEFMEALIKAGYDPNRIVDEKCNECYWYAMCGCYSDKTDKDLCNSRRKEVGYED